MVSKEPSRLQHEEYVRSRNMVMTAAAEDIKLAGEIDIAMRKNFKKENMGITCPTDTVEYTSAITPIELFESSKIVRI